MHLPLEEGPCPSCVALLGQLDGAAEHASQKINFAVVAKAPLPRLLTFAEERGWRRRRLLSSAGNTYNRDYLGETAEGSQMPMLNVFHRDGETIGLPSASQVRAAVDMACCRRFLNHPVAVIDYVKPQAQPQSFRTNQRVTVASKSSVTTPQDRQLVPPCRASSLRASADWQGENTTKIGAVTFSLRGRSACSLRGRPRILVRVNGHLQRVRQLDGTWGCCPV